MSEIAAVIFLCHARVICARLKKTGSDGWDPRGSERKEEEKKREGRAGLVLAGELGCWWVARGQKKRWAWPR